MKTTKTLPLLLGLAAALLGTACSTRNDDTVVLPPAQDPEPQAGAQAEAVGQLVSPEIERALEAEYQASRKRLEDESAFNPHYHNGQTTVNFEALFEEIRNTMPPARGVLLRKYVGAAQQLSDAATRTALLERLSSPELDNVR
jgi:hypothetical protein